ncbi:hypothetical protein KIN20_011077 [Parelaphostrongylus tenuis]|uniref:Uncharacterized protein n=1 Tax=Parelaphostrongylus tenuis TaxID=148309 RepID=A0AAD5MAH0_PARTN|nr:hypothetical protein KIN20_011077 [Parelaphostrongylus tenuis]
MDLPLWFLICKMVIGKRNVAAATEEELDELRVSQCVDWKKNATEKLMTHADSDVLFQINTRNKTDHVHKDKWSVKYR